MDDADVVVPSYVARRIRTPIPPGCSVLKGSTPVISFGNARMATVATLGLNPSAREFVVNGTWLAGLRRRLATLDHLGISDLEAADDATVAEVLRGCDAYFERNPYWQWFSPLDRLLQISTECSYRDGSACHLDLVQWATDPVWRGLAAAVRNRLVRADANFLFQQLTAERVEVVLLNGSTVMNAVQALGIQLEPVDEVAAEGRRSRLVMGQHQSAVFVGWSMNLQGNRAGRFGLEIAERVRAELAVLRPHRPDPESEHLPRGLVMHSTGELRERLKQWARSSSAVTIGEAGSYAGRPWVFAEIGPERVTLNADTTRLRSSPSWPSTMRPFGRWWLTVVAASTGWSTAPTTISRGGTATCPGREAPQVPSSKRPHLEQIRRAPVECGVRFVRLPVSFRCSTNDL